MRRLLLRYRHRPRDEQRIDAGIAPLHAPVEMRTGRAASHADKADELAALHPLTDMDCDLREMKKGAVEAHAMVDHQQIALQREGMIRRENDDTIGWGERDGTGRPGD